MATRRQHDDRHVSIVERVKTKLGFFVVCVLVFEVILGAVAGFSSDTTATVTVVGMLVVFLVLILVVAFSKTSDLITDRIQPSVPAQLHDFCRSVAGHWWSCGTDPGFVGFVDISHDESAGTLAMHGRSYDTEGKLGYVWQSKASCVSRDLKTLYYCWDGYHIPATPDKPREWREGFGEISFQVSLGGADSADGSFFDTNLADAMNVTKKSSEFRRCTAQEVKDMKGTDDERIARVKKQLKIK